jgi:hypothetical protein
MLTIAVDVATTNTAVNMYLRYAQCYLLEVQYTSISLGCEATLKNGELALLFQSIVVISGSVPRTAPC